MRELNWVSNFKNERENCCHFYIIYFLQLWKERGGSGTDMHWLSGLPCGQNNVGRVSSLPSSCGVCQVMQVIVNCMYALAPSCFKF